MPDTLRITQNAIYNGITNTTEHNVNYENAATSNPTLPLAKAGTLTTRTDANTGVLTMSGGHGLQDADVIDLFWDGGSRRGMTVGTVATNSVPVDGGSGDDLPATSTVIAAMVPHEESLTVTGDDATAISVYSGVPGYVAFLEAEDVDAKVIRFTSQNSYLWSNVLEGTNPLASASILKVTFSHGQTATVPSMRVAVMHD